MHIYLFQMPFLDIPALFDATRPSSQYILGPVSKSFSIKAKLKTSWAVKRQPFCATTAAAQIKLCWVPIIQWAFRGYCGASTHGVCDVAVDVRGGWRGLCGMTGGFGGSVLVCRVRAEGRTVRRWVARIRWARVGVGAVQAGRVQTSSWGWRSDV
jgi:hypothetical protein